MSPRPIILNEIISCLFYIIFFPKPKGSLVYMPNYSGKKTWSLIHCLSRFLDYWPLQNRALPPTLGKTLLKLCNLKTLQSKISLFFIMCIFLWRKKPWIGIKCIFHECWRTNKKKTFCKKKSQKGLKGVPSNTLKHFSAKCFDFFFNIMKNGFDINSRFFSTKICT